MCSILNRLPPRQPQSLRAVFKCVEQGKSTCRRLIPVSKLLLETLLTRGTGYKASSDDICVRSRDSYKASFVTSDHDLPSPPPRGSAAE